MADRPAPGYGTPNWDMIGRWLHLDPADDGPFWALNLMRYRDLADYGDAGGAGGAPRRSGKEADDAYAPLGPLAAIGAMVAFHGDVVDQPLGEPGWHRVGIVRYPSRAAFFAMQQRDDFKEQHVHKEAGMEFTIVLATHPESHGAAADGADGGGALVMVVERGAEPSGWADHPGVAPVATFSVEGVIVGDERTFDRVLFARADDDALAALPTAGAGADEVHATVLSPEIDELVASITSAPTGGAA